jgi:hypothetical protein
MILQGSAHIINKVCRQLRLCLPVFSLNNDGQDKLDQGCAWVKKILLRCSVAWQIQLQDKCIIMYMKDHVLMIAPQNVPLLYRFTKKTLLLKIESKIKL